MREMRKRERRRRERGRSDFSLSRDEERNGAGELSRQKLFPSREREKEIEREIQWEREKRERGGEEEGMG